ncbi:MAG: response regulator [Myxococcota bacterium]
MSALEQPRSELGSMLIVDDDAVFRAHFARMLKRRGFEVCAVASVGEALSVVDEIEPRRAVVDLKMPGGSGLDLVRTLAARTPPVPVVVLTGYGSIATALEAMRRGATHYLTKPADVDEVLKAFEQGLDSLPPSSVQEVPKTPSLARTEWEHIHRVLADTGGNISETARRLGLQRRTLQRKLKAPPPAD